MSKIRVWKLGSLEHKIVPTQEAANKLRTILAPLKDDKDCVLDIVWGPDLEVQVVEGDDDIILMDEVCESYLKERGYNVSKEEDIS